MKLKNILIFLIEEYVKIRKELFLELDASEKSIKKDVSKVVEDIKNAPEFHSESKNEQSTTQ
jgi:hypothetical protein